MKEYETFIQHSILNYRKYVPTPVECKQIKLDGVERYIYGKLTSRKFRSKAVPKRLARFIKSVVRNAVKRNEPIHITIPFGGYKKYQFDTAPHIDWSEVFNIKWLIDYLSPIVSVYKPGVILNYYSDEIFMTRMNKISQSDIDIYNNEMEAMCNYFSDITPDNLEIQYSKIRDEISYDELHRRFDRIIAELKVKWDEVDEVTKKTRLTKSKRNFNGNLANLSHDQKQEVLVNSTLVHDAFIFGDWDYDVHWAFESHMIPIGFRYTGDWGIPIYSAKGSVVQFWVGRGVLEERGERLIPRIYTLEQLKLVDDLITHETISVFPSFPGLSTIPVLTLR